MKVADILAVKSSDIATTRPDSRVSTVAGLLKLKRIGALVVSDDGDHIAGIISERDIVQGLVDHGEELLKMPVSEIMTRTVKTCAPDAAITEIMAEMTRSRIRHLPVVTDGRLIGIVSIGDVVKNRLDELQSEANVLRDYFVSRSA